MTYKEKFEASENRAHYQNIATKILREMSTLRSLVENSPIAPRRWIWELIQNAKDVHQEDGVKIILDYHQSNGSSNISFKHNGKPFTADNIRFLIEQISSKDRNNDNLGKRKTTGKFGTGFLTTHLLSEIVKVEGVAKEPELEHRKFNLELDRSGFELKNITDSVQNSKDSVQNLDEYPPYVDYIEGNFNTKFTYSLSDTIGLSVAEAGIKDLKQCLPFTFVFANDITSVEIKNENLLFKNTEHLDVIDDNIEAITIDICDKNNDDTISSYSFAVINKNFTTIAMPIKIDGENIELLPINKTTPRLFCDFPLIGTEVFPFPTIINNPNFNPTDPRDGVYLTSSQRTNPLAEENKIFISEAVELYYQLLDFASKNEWGNLHLLAQIKPLYSSPNWIDDNWFERNVLTPIRQKLLSVKIVRTADEKIQAIQNSSNNKYIWFPNSSNAENRSELWKISNYWFPYRLPRESDLELWNKLTWSQCGKLTTDQLACFIQNQKTLEELSKVLKGIDANQWLEQYYDFVKKEDEEYDSIINNRAIFPNQHGNLVIKATLMRDSGDIGNDFKDILDELGIDIREKLLDEKISFDLGDDKVIDVSYAVKEINSEVNNKANDREVAKSYKSAFKKLLIWFQENPSKSKELFPNLYRNKHLLYDDEEILENITKAEQLNELLNEFDVKDLSQIRELISNAQSNTKSILPVTENILLDMGISSLEEWEDAIQDKNLENIFSHKSTPTTDMFVFVQGLIEKAKQNVIETLNTLPEYDLDNIDTSTAPTILAGIIKDGKEISIVVRPAYNDEVIIYYGSERDILDYEPSELWIDDDLCPRQITLGHILKSANIVKFPV